MLDHHLHVQIMICTSKLNVLLKIHAAWGKRPNPLIIIIVVKQGQRGINALTTKKDAEMLS